MDAQEKSLPQAKAAPEAMGSPGEAYEAVLGCLARGAGRRVLDAPAGKGALTRLLLDRGYEVSASDIVPELFEVAEVPCLAGNLNERLPYPDASFDAVTSCNGLHRVLSLGRSVSEYARVLRPGGRLLITLPNFTKLSRRVRFLFSGVISWAAVRSAKVTEEPEAHHRHAVSLTEILLALQACGLELASVQGVQQSGARVVLWPIVLFLRAALIFFPARRRRDYFLKETATFPALFSDFLLVEARKPGKLSATT
jgi:SAM-dependent methyltransferase